MSGLTDHDAARFLTRSLRVFARHDDSVALQAVSAERGALLLRIAVYGSPVVVRVSPATDPTAWQRTASFVLALGTGASPDLEPPLRAWADFLRHADPGGLRLPEPPATAEPDAPVPKGEPRDVGAARAELASVLHRASFIALKVVTTEDLYPHVTTLGVPTPFEEIQAGWRSALARRASRGPDKLGLYVHVPFCTVACTFCYCAKTDQFKRDDVGRYTAALEAEARGFAPLFVGQRFTSVYFGGGTPSLLPAPAMRQLFGVLYDSFDVPAGTQVIYEGNPDSLDENKIQAMAEVGRVTRLTIGVQTLDDEVQRIVRRHNKPEHVERAIQAARRFGIPHVNVDLMSGLPGQTEESFARDLDFLVSLEPDSIHLNAFRPLSRVGYVRDGGTFDGEDAARRDRMQAAARERLASTGFNSDSGQGPRKTADAANLQEFDLRRQNSSLLGLGFPARAHSFGGHYYSPDLAPGVEPGLAADRERRTWRAVASDEREEQHKYLVSNLRTGWEEAEFQALFGVSSRSAAPEGIARLEALGYLSEAGGRWHFAQRPTDEFSIARVLLYSETHLARAFEVWGADYDATADYAGELHRIVGHLS